MTSVHLVLSNLGEMTLLVNLLDAIAKLGPVTIILTSRNTVDHQLLLFGLIFWTIIRDIER